MKTPEQIVADAKQAGNRRSAEYWRGALDVLRYRIHGERIACPYQEGSTQFDAYFAGADRGHALWRMHREGAPA